MTDPADLAHLAALAREALADADALEQAEAYFRSRVRESEPLTHAAAAEGVSAVFGATVGEVLDGHLARRPR